MYRSVVWRRSRQSMHNTASDRRNFVKTIETEKNQDDQKSALALKNCHADDKSRISISIEKIISLSATSRSSHGSGGSAPSLRSLPLLWLIYIKAIINIPARTLWIFILYFLFVHLIAYYCEHLPICCNFLATFFRSSFAFPFDSEETESVNCNFAFVYPIN